jgi:soluble lytic murein transglycosylase-like protein
VIDVWLVAHRSRVKRQEVFPMTPLLSAVRSAARGEESLQRGPARAIAVALLAIVSVALLSASAQRRGASTADPRTQAVAVLPRAQQSATGTGPAQRVATASSRSIDALADVIARKYRISPEATRDLVGTAYREGERNGVDPLLIIAVMAVESRFNPIAESDAGAIGLMQVIPRYHSDKFDATGNASVLNPHTNIRIGARLLKEYIRRGGSQIAGLQLYNGAPGDATNAYANKVLGEKQRLQGAVRSLPDRV